MHIEKLLGVTDAAGGIENLSLPESPELIIIDNMTDNEVYLYDGEYSDPITTNQKPYNILLPRSMKIVVAAKGKTKYTLAYGALAAGTPKQYIALIVTSDIRYKSYFNQITNKEVEIGTIQAGNNVIGKVVLQDTVGDISDANPLPVNGTVEITNDAGNPLPVSGEIEVTNDAGNPLPVSGTIEVTNDAGNPLPVSGTVTSERAGKSATKYNATGQVKAAAGLVYKVRAIGTDVTLRDDAVEKWFIPTGTETIFDPPILCNTDINIVLAGAGSAFVQYE